MSAIFGLIHTEEEFIDKQLLKRMSSIVDYRGPDGEGIWSDKNAGLGHRLLITTQESVGEKQPLTNGQGVWITADCRIDNRGELEEKFKSHEAWRRLERQSGTLPDSAFILFAYELWKEEAPLHLWGDFSFAIWDSDRRMLFCARDPIGIKPFHYFWNEKKIIFGSEIKQIFQDPGVPQTLNQIHLADWIMLAFANRWETCYQAVRRLPPGHFLTLKGGRFEVKSYWNWNPDSEPLSTASLEENAEQFRFLFEEAVRARLRCPVGLQAGSLLSGGLDSSSMVAAAASMKALEKGSDGRFPVFTLLFPEANPRYGYPEYDPVDERPYWEPLVESHGLKSTPVEIKGWGPLQNLKEHFWHQDMPLCFFNFAAFQHLFKIVRDSGVRILLHGEGGDELFHPGNGWISELLVKGCWKKFIEEVRGRNRNLGTPWPRILNLVWRRLIPEILKVPYRRLKNYVPDWVSPGFARQAGVRSRLKEIFLENARLGRSRSYGLLCWTQGNHIPLLLETIDRMAASSHIEVRLPFLDLRLFRFMATVPWDQKRSRGVNKLLLREALKEFLPPPILNRQRKTEFTPAMGSAMKIYAEAEMRQVFESPHPVLAPMICPRRVKKRYEIFFKSKRRDSSKLSTSFSCLWYLVSVDQWLKNTVNDQTKGESDGIRETTRQAKT